MNIFKRLETTLRADANGLIDALEEPTLMLKQHLRDAELALHEEQAALSRLEQEAKRLGTERERADLVELAGDRTPVLPEREPDATEDEQEQPDAHGVDRAGATGAGRGTGGRVGQVLVDVRRALRDVREVARHAHPGAPPSSRASQAAAKLQSRRTVRSVTPTTSAISFSASPPKKRSSTTCAGRG